MNSSQRLGNPPREAGEGEELTELRAWSDLVERAMQRAVKAAIAAHHRTGSPVAIWKDGRVVLWYPDGSYRPVLPASGDADRSG
jgi:hypothetical protein